MRIAMLGCKGIPAFGGIETHVENVSRLLVQRGHSVSVYCRRQYTDPGLGRVLDGVQRIFTWGVRGKHLDALTHTVTAAIHAALGRYDLIHIHGAGQSLVTPLLRLLSPRSRVVVTIHGLDWRRPKWSPLARWLIRTAAKVCGGRAHATIVINRQDKQLYEAEFGRTASLIFPCNGVVAEPADPEEILKLGLESGRYILAMARLVPEKRIHDLVDAFEKLDPDYPLVIAGGQNYKDPYAAKLLDRKNPKILFVGYVSGRLKRELLSHAALFASPSELEGLPISVLEAMGYGRCVIASDIVPHQDALAGTGILHTLGDQDDLAAKLGELLAAPEERRRLGQLAEQRAREVFTWERVADAMGALYDSLVPRRIEVP